ncbi:hypothetical protein [Paenibacillus polymyxa]|uniref:hypothetical protein n=1 Tax=Paenibacillus polymyxa TaxID=1406 RepID=UPI0005CDEB9C|nr:hypothetical protein [Paenibacillus polymyxa]MBY7740255.1 YvrJ family protein [Paenibacillus polymyxa]MEE4581027.1 hypothetical protein [Paenibacillus polymyxa]
MDTQAIANLLTNVGFPVAMCVILLRYVLQNMEKQFNQLNLAVKELTLAIQNLHVEFKQTTLTSLSNVEKEKKTF